MQIIEILHRTFPNSRYPGTVSNAPGLDTTMVTIAAEPGRGRRPLVGYGFTSFGRYGQEGLIRDRFLPRLARETPG